MRLLLTVFALTAISAAAATPPAPAAHPAASPPAATAAAPPAAGNAAAPPAAAPADSSGTRMGLTILGDRETPLGLFITPWKNAYAPERRDRPALLLDEAPLPVDPETFKRQVSYGEAFNEYRKSAPPSAVP